MIKGHTDFVRLRTFVGLFSDGSSFRSCSSFLGTRFQNLSDFTGFHFGSFLLRGSRFGSRFLRRCRLLGRSLHGFGSRSSSSRLQLLPALDLNIDQVRLLLGQAICRPAFPEAKAVAEFHKVIPCSLRFQLVPQTEKKECFETARIFRFLFLRSFGFQLVIDRFDIDRICYGNRNSFIDGVEHSHFFPENQRRFGIGDRHHLIDLPTFVLGGDVQHRNVLTPDDFCQQAGLVHVFQSERFLVGDGFHVVIRKNGDDMISPNPHLLGFVHRNRDHIFRCDLDQTDHVSIAGSIAPQIATLGHMQTVGAKDTTIVIDQFDIHLNESAETLFQGFRMVVDEDPFLGGFAQRFVGDNRTIVCEGEVHPLQEDQSLLNGVLPLGCHGPQTFNERAEAKGLTRGHSGLSVLLQGFSAHDGGLVDHGNHSGLFDGQGSGFRILLGCVQSLDHLVSDRLRSRLRFGDCFAFFVRGNVLDETIAIDRTTIRTNTQQSAEFLFCNAEEFQETTRFFFDLREHRISGHVHFDRNLSGIDCLNDLIDHFCHTGIGDGNGFFFAIFGIEDSASLRHCRRNHLDCRRHLWAFLLRCW